MCCFLGPLLFIALPGILKIVPLRRNGFGPWLKRITFKAFRLPHNQIGDRDYSQNQRYLDCTEKSTSQSKYTSREEWKPCKPDVAEKTLYLMFRRNFSFLELTEERNQFDYMTLGEGRLLVVLALALHWVEVIAQLMKTWKLFHLFQIIACRPINRRESSACDRPVVCKPRDRELVFLVSMSSFVTT